MTANALPKFSALLHAQADGSAETTLESYAAHAEREIVFIDQGVKDYASLVRDVGLERSASRRIEIVLLDANRDGVEQITDFLRDQHNIDGIHLLSHGASGRLQLGSTQLDHDSLADYADQPQVWHSALSEGGDLLLYGCKVAAGRRGVEFIRQLGAAAGADIASSVDVTGGTPQEGDWDLERTIGVIDVATLFHDSNPATFTEELVTITANQVQSTVTIDNTRVTIDHGGSNVPYSFYDHPSQEGLQLVASAANVTFDFQARLGLNNSDIDLSSLRGDATTSVNFSQYGDDDSQLEFSLSDQGVLGSGDGIEVLENNVTIFKNIEGINSLVGGQGDNHFEFAQNWTGTIAISIPTLRNDDSEQVLNLSAMPQNLKVAVGSGQGEVTFDVSASGGTPIATAKNMKRVMPGGNIALDLSALQDATIEVGDNGEVTVQVPLQIPVVATPPMEFEHVTSIRLGTGANTLRINSANNGITAITPPVNGVYSVVLDYTDFPGDANVNLGAALNLAENAQSTKTKPTNEVAGMAHTYELTVGPNNGATMRLQVGDQISPPINVTAGNSAALIDQALDNMANVKRTANTLGNGSVLAPWQVSLLTVDNSPLLASPEMVSVVEDVDGAGNWRLAIPGSGGTFGLNMLLNGFLTTVDNIPLNNAREDPSVLANAVQQMLRNQGFPNATVSAKGAGTNLSPWEISLQMAAGVSISGIAGAVTSNESFLYVKSTQVGSAPTLPVWRLYNTSNGGMFRLRVSANNNVATTRDLPFDAHASSIKRAIELAANFVDGVTVTGDDGSFSLTLNGGAPVRLPYDVQIDDFRAALESMDGVGTGNVDVMSIADGDWMIEFIGSLAGKDMNELSGDFSKLTKNGKPANGSVSTLSDGGNAGANTVQRITHDGTRGFLTLSYDQLATTYLDYNAAAANVRVALQHLSTVGFGNVVVAADPNTPQTWTVVFQGDFANTNPAQFVGDFSNVRRGGAPRIHRFGPSSREAPLRLRCCCMMMTPRHSSRL